MSAAFWAFEPDDSARRLVGAVRDQTQVENFDLAVILGSGWKGVASLAQPLGVFDYKAWPCFPAGQITGHGGQLIAARYSSWNILFFTGRFHCYQGLSAFQAAFPVRLSAALGCQRILLCCATGGINESLRPGDFMLVEDHLNFLGDNPLRGLDGETFIDLTGMYQQELYQLLAGQESDGPVLHRGILAAMPGPSYETPAEIRYLRNIGADVVSMSTVHEAIMARYLGLQVAAIAFVANYAAGIKADRLDHEDVLACGAEHAETFPVVTQRLIHAWQTLSS